MEAVIKETVDKIISGIEFDDSCERFTKDNAYNILMHAFTDFNHLREGVSYVRDECDDIADSYEFDYAEENAYEEEHGEHSPMYKKWWLIGYTYKNQLIDGLEANWVHIKGKHDLDEACEKAAKKWADLTFGFHIQDNGALDQGPSMCASALATSMAEKRKSSIPDDVKERARKLMAGIYKAMLTDDQQWLNENIREKCEGIRFINQDHMSVDYDPSPLLMAIYKIAGVSDEANNFIWPWKTTIRIDPKDNTVCYYKYGKVEYM